MSRATPVAGGAADAGAATEGLVRRHARPHGTRAHRRRAANGGGEQAGRGAHPGRQPARVLPSPGALRPAHRVADGVGRNDAGLVSRTSKHCSRSQAQPCSSPLSSRGVAASKLKSCVRQCAVRTDHCAFARSPRRDYGPETRRGTRVAALLLNSQSWFLLSAPGVVRAQRVLRTGFVRARCVSAPESSTLDVPPFHSRPCSICP